MIEHCDAISKFRQNKLKIFNGLLSFPGKFGTQKFEQLEIQYASIRKKLRQHSHLVEKISKISFGDTLSLKKLALG